MAIEKKFKVDAGIEAPEVVVTGNIQAGASASPAPSINGFSSIEFADGSVQTTAYTTSQQYGYFVTMNNSGDNNRVSGEAVTVDSGGNTYVSYSYYDDNDSKRYGGVAKFSPTGSKLWSQNVIPNNNDADYAKIVSLEISNVGNLVAIGYYYDNNTNYDKAFMYLLDPNTGSLGSMFDTEASVAGGMQLEDGVFGSDNANSQPYAALVGSTYNEQLVKTFTPIAPSTTNKLYISWTEFAASGLGNGSQIIYNVGGYYGATVNEFNVEASPDGISGGIGLRVASTGSNGTYIITGVNGWSGAIYGWTDPVNLRVLGSNLGGVDGVNDFTFDFSVSIFNNNSNNIQAATSNLTGLSIAEVYCPAFNGKDWGAEIGNPLNFDYYLNNQAYVARLGGPNWMKSLGVGNSYERFYSVAVDNNDNIYAVGQYQSNTGHSGIVVKYDIDGNQQWAVYVDPANDLGITLYSVDLLPDGNLICVGDEGVVTKLSSADGSIIWQTKIDTNDNISWDSDFKGTATPSGDYIFTNYEDNDYKLYVIKLNGSDGNVSYTKEISRYFAGSNGEIYPQDDFAAQYIDCNDTTFSIAATTYIYLGTSIYNGLVINLPVDGGNVDGTYDQFVINSYSMPYEQPATTSVAATVNVEDTDVNTIGASATTASFNMTAQTIAIGGGEIGTGNVTFDNVTVQGDNTSLNLSAGPDFTANSAYLQVRAGDNPTHIHLDTGNNEAYDQYFGNDSKYLKLGLGIAGNVSIGTYQDGGVGQLIWVFDSNGNLILANGEGVIQSAPNSSLDPLNPNVSTMVLTPDASYTSQALVLDPTAPGHIHLRSPAANIDEPYANIFLGGENTSFEIGAYYGAPPNAFVHSNNHTWTFSSDGNLITPGLTGTYIKSTANGYIGVAAIDDGLDQPAQLVSINSNTGLGTTAISAYANDALIQTNITGGNMQTWVFSNTGNLTLPGNTFAINYANGTQVPLGGGGSYGDSNVVSLLSSFGSNTITTTGVITGNGSGLTNIAGANVTGTVANANLAQFANVTSVSNNYSYHIILSGGPGDKSLHVDGSDNLQYDPAEGVLTAVRVDAGFLVGDLSFANGYNVSNVVGIGNIATINTNGNASQVLYGNGVFAGLPSVSLTGDGGNLSNIAGANVSGQVSYAAVANSVAAANVSGLGNVSTINLDGNASNLLSGAGTFVAIPVVPTVGNIATINLDGNSSNVLLGNGVFSSAPAPTSIVNGTSNVVVASSGNVTVGVAGTANVITATSTGANVTGTLNVTGNVTAQGTGSNIVRRAFGLVETATMGQTTSQYAVTLDDIIASVNGTNQLTITSTALPPATSPTLTGFTQTMTSGSIAVQSWVNINIQPSFSGLSGAMNTQGSGCIAVLSDQTPSATCYRVTVVRSGTAGAMWNISIERLV